MRTPALLVAILMVGCMSPGSPDVAPDAGATCDPGHPHPTPDAGAAVTPDAGPALGPDASSPDATPPDQRPALVLLLAGYTQHATWFDAAWHIQTIDPSVAILLPIDGSPDSTGKLSWNASVSCCDDTLANDDETRLVAAVQARIAIGDVNPSKVWVWGQSNGAFMAIRLACDHADLFAGAVEFSGAGPAAGDPVCAPSQPVSILDVHGTGDTTIDYSRVWRARQMAVSGVPESGPGGTSDQLATALGCGAPTVATGALDLDADIAGPETDVLTYACTRGAFEHWRIVGGVHAPTLVAAWPELALAWAEAHSR